LTAIGVSIPGDLAWLQLARMDASWQCAHRRADLKRFFLLLTISGGRGQGLFRCETGSQSLVDSLTNRIARHYPLCMNGMHEGPRATGLGPDGESLDAVMGRFQNWAKTRRDKAALSNGRSAGKIPEVASRKVDLDGEAREISYEQALRARRYRRPVEIAPTDPPLVPLPTPSLDPHPDSGKAVRAADKRAPVSEPKPDVPSPAAPAAKIESRSPTAVSSPVRATEVTTLQAPGARAPRAKVAKARETRAVIPAQIQASPEAALETRAAAKSNKKRAANFTSPDLTRAGQPDPPVFCDVLKETVALAAVIHSGPSAVTVERGKSTSLTLRVSEQEQARIQACAAQANLSVSAYLRQCALGVDSLRDQVGLALSDLHKQQARAVSPPGISAIPGILASFAGQCIHRLRRKSGDPTILSLR